MIEYIPRLHTYGWLLHGISTRQGGVSAAPHDTLNVGFSRPDDPAAVLENRQRIATHMGFALDDVVMAAQTHGTHVLRVTEQQRGSGAIDPDTILPSADGLVTDVPGLVLWAGFADCVPLLFVDPLLQAVGVAHAGWQGTLGNIAGETVATMQREFGSQPADLLTVIGPSIGPCCYEVDEPVIGRVHAVLGADADTVLVRPPGGERPHLDLWRANALLLERAGIYPERIVRSDICTACNVERFFSHRREGGRTGRFAAIIGIRRDAEAC